MNGADLSPFIITEIPIRNKQINARDCVIVMAEICRGVVSESEGSATCKHPSPRSARRRRMELRRIKFVAGEPAAEDSEAENKRPKLELPQDCAYTSENSGVVADSDNSVVLSPPVAPLSPKDGVEGCPRYGLASVCGRRRDMEDAVAVHPSFFRSKHGKVPESHYFGIYDGHGCSHVATRCRERLHELVKEELENKEACTAWRSAMEQSFSRMDKEIIAWNKNGTGRANCRCELQSPKSDAVGSTAVTAVITSDKIIVANCGDSRAVLCRGGKAIPLSTDHKPDRPDELNRIQAAGGRVIFWDSPRVLGVLAMSRAIGDNYFKPYVSSEPEVTETNRTAEDDCLILASDGLWDVISNETACSVARMCLRGKAGSSSATSAARELCMMIDGEAGGRDGRDGNGKTDKACSDASMLLTKLALARRSTDNVSVVVIDLRRDT